jgi:pseudouridine-5'-monophosphatase
MTHRPPITHVIFDMDGVLLDTEPFYTSASAEICARYGREFTMAHKSQMLGRPNLDAAAYLVAALELPLTAEAFLLERESVLDALFLTTVPMPGAVELTDHLHSQGVPHAVASSSSQRTFALKSGRFEAWFGRFDVVVLGDDREIAAGKPAPDIFLLAARRMAARPEQCLVVEDSPAGIAAGRAAGMTVVAIADSKLEPALFTEADAVLPSLTKFDPEAWGLPAFGPTLDLGAAAGS